MSSSLLIPEKVKEGSEALLDILKDDRVSKTKKLLGIPAPIFLQVDFVKIPKVTRRVIRIPLRNNVLTDSSDVCLIVADLIRGRKVNHEVTLNHYKKLLEKKGVMEAQKLHVMSSRQIRVDYAPYEAKRKLCKMFDIFLIDNKISNYLRPKLGKEFPKARKWPIPIRMKRKDLKSEISSKLLKTSLALDGSGTTKTVQVGHVNMTPLEIAENIICVSEYIAERFPGGWDNIRTLHIKGLRSIALPIYMSLVSRNNVPVPTIKSRKRKRIIACQEVSIVGKKVTVYRSGRVKINNKSTDSDDDAEIDKEILESMAPEKKKRKLDNEEKKDMTADEETKKTEEKNPKEKKAKKATVDEGEKKKTEEKNSKKEKIKKTTVDKAKKKKLEEKNPEEDMFILQKKKSKKATMDEKEKNQLQEKNLKKKKSKKTTEDKKEKKLEEKILKKKKSKETTEGEKETKFEEKNLKKKMARKTTIDEKEKKKLEKNLRKKKSKKASMDEKKKNQLEKNLKKKKTRSSGGF